MSTETPIARVVTWKRRAGREAAANAGREKRAANIERVEQTSSKSDRKTSTLFTPRFSFPPTARPPSKTMPLYSATTGLTPTTSSSSDADWAAGLLDGDAGSTRGAPAVPARASADTQTPLPQLPRRRRRPSAAPAAPASPSSTKLDAVLAANAAFARLKRDRDAATEAAADAEADAVAARGEAAAADGVATAARAAAADAEARAAKADVRAAKRNAETVRAVAAARAAEERASSLEAYLNAARADLDAADDKIRRLNLAAGAAARDAAAARAGAAAAASLRREVATLAATLLTERTRAAALEAELETPRNMHR